MTFRADVTVDWSASPRIITVASPSVEITIQDLVDTCRVLESQIANLGYPHLINAAGKEALGGGTFVGITATLQNALVAFEPRAGAAYEQCRVNGGNLIAIDDVGNYLATPIYPTAFTQVVTTASSSATTQSQAQLEHSTFNSRVTLDISNGFAGTAFPIGTESMPSNNLDDAKTIATNRGFTTLQVNGVWTLGASDVLTGFNVVGSNPTSTIITLTQSATVTGCQFSECAITGEVDSACTFRNCSVTDLVMFRGYLFECSLHGTIGLGGGVEADILSCYSGEAAVPVILDCGGSGQSASIRAWSGRLKVINLTDAARTVSVDMIGGVVIVDLATVTNGTIATQGNGEVVDQNGNYLNHSYYGNVYIDNYAMNGKLQQELWQLAGLDVNNPMTVTATTRTAGSIDLTITGDNETGVTVTRQ